MSVYDGTTIFETGLCPHCGSPHCHVEKTMKPVRRMSCDECNSTWKSITVNLLQDNALQKAADIQQQKIELESNYPFL